MERGNLLEVEPGGNNEKQKIDQSAEKKSRLVRGTGFR